MLRLAEQRRAFPWGTAGNSATPLRVLGFDPQQRRHDTSGDDDYVRAAEPWFQRATPQFEFAGIDSGSGVSFLRCRVDASPWAATGCVSIFITDVSVPALADLRGTVFSVAPRAPADGNCSGGIDIGDALMVRRTVAGVAIGATCGGLIDADNDRLTTALDALVILRQLAGLP